ncbi:MAG: glycine dehydrogenase (aminomethyl-transferring) [Deltaproteobacteria bacterium GWC2_42_11]|nr:MAG: glycine dehydrogenase (aminomethyl-transferring) [Deltaproteobacteria bacterium GWC2_42_11]HBO85092.1 aminomethyl-transferring glycine dehydrogenase subunit GcvPA [Deltaproteobacteria bacterium]
MSYIPHTEDDVKKMLDVIDIKTVNDLFKAVPPDIRLKKPLNLPEPLSEQEVQSELANISRKNATVEDYISFIGGGAYNHYIPSIVNHIILRSEFYTAYTPYQPEISQGTLQAIFEYQTLICQLTGMDIANASMYDGASAAAEAVLMAKRINSRQKCLISSAVHPEYRDTVRTYLANQRCVLTEIPYCTETGTTPLDAVEKYIDTDTSCVVIQYPNFFGSLENIESISDIVRKNNSLLVVVITEPISLGLLKPPGKLGADIVAGEGQAFGNPLNFGGPYLGFFATNEKYIRNMPGRLVGETVDRDGKRGYVLTLATREQHIRREKATSNICTNEGLCALTAAVYLAALGKTGLIEVAKLNLNKMQYLKEQLKGLKNIRPAFTAPTFNESVIDVNQDAESVIKSLLKKGILAGVPLKRFYSELKSHILVCTTEMNTKEQIDLLIEGLAKI